MATKQTQRQDRGADRRAGERRTPERRAPRAPRGPDRRLQLPDPAELIGFAVHALDEALGEIESFCFENDSWGVTEIVVVTRRRRGVPPRLFVPLGAVERVDRRGRSVQVGRRPENLREWSKSRSSC